mmetsp:Transcript_7309/g.20781  ORF Transcript_7309/g.20781 Transcript_7309/m.20781 type:complete len:279 (+) Transcript_7309:797-1633(+)
MDEVCILRLKDLGRPPRLRSPKSVNVPLYGGYPIVHLFLITRTHIERLSTLGGDLKAKLVRRTDTPVYDFLLHKIRSIHSKLAQKLFTRLRFEIANNTLIKNKPSPLPRLEKVPSLHQEALPVPLRIDDQRSFTRRRPSTPRWLRLRRTVRLCRTRNGDINPLIVLVLAILIAIELGLEDRLKHILHGITLSLVVGVRLHLRCRPRCLWRRYDDRIIRLAFLLPILTVLLLGRGFLLPAPFVLHPTLLVYFTVLGTNPCACRHRSRSLAPLPFFQPLS